MILDYGRGRYLIKTVINLSNNTRSSITESYLLTSNNLQNMSFVEEFDTEPFGTKHIKDGETRDGLMASAKTWEARKNKSHANIQKWIDAGNDEHALLVTENKQGAFQYFKIIRTMKQPKQPKQKKAKLTLNEQIEIVKEKKRKAADALDEETPDKNATASHNLLTNEPFRKKSLKLIKLDNEEKCLEKKLNSKDDTEQENTDDLVTTDEDNSDTGSVESAEAATAGA